MKLTAAHRLFYFIEQYGTEAGIQAFYADQAFYPNAVIKVQALLNLEEDKSETFLCSLSTPITAVS